MNRLIILCLTSVIAIGCSDKIKFNTKVRNISEIQKMDNIVEVSIWDCGKFEKPRKCDIMRKLSAISDKQKISEIMAVVRELKIVSATGDDIPGILICFKDKSG